MSRVVAAALAVTLLGPVVDLDHRVQSAVQSRRGPVADRVMRAATDLGRRDVLAWGLLAIAVLDGVEGPGTVRRALVALAGTNLTVEGLKRLVARPRPDGERNPANSSFPSGHAASAFGLALVLARRWRRASAALWLLAALVAFSRIYLNRHFLSDVVSGVALGLLVTWLVLARWPVRSPPARERGG